MTRSLETPHLPRTVRKTKNRVDSIERQLKPRLPRPNPYEITYSLPGAVVLSESGRGRHPTGGRLITVDAHLQTAGSTDTIITVNKSGVSIGTLTIPSGATYADRVFDEIFSARLNVISMEVTTAGTDAEDLTVFAQFDQ